jgi:flagellar biosynthesis protein FlhG
MIAVTGAADGVGATTVAVNLAAALADLDLRVVVVEAADQQADLSLRMGIAPANEYGLSDVVSGSCSAGDALMPGPAGTMVLTAHGRASARRRFGSASSSPAGSFSRHAQQRLLRELQSLNKVANVIIIDTGTGSTPWIQRFWLRARLGILVTTTDDSAVMKAYAAIKRTATAGIAVQTTALANQCDSDAHARLVYGRLSAACQRFLSRKLSTLPPLPLQLAESGRNSRVTPRAWESPNTSFGHAVLWLGRAVSDLISPRDVEAPLPTTARRFYHREISSC